MEFSELTKLVGEYFHAAGFFCCGFNFNVAMTLTPILSQFTWLVLNYSNTYEIFFTMIYTRTNERTGIWKKPHARICTKWSSVLKGKTGKHPRWFSCELVYFLRLLPLWINYHRPSYALHSYKYRRKLYNANLGGFTS